MLGALKILDIFQTCCKWYFGSLWSLDRVRRRSCKVKFVLFLY